MSFKTWALGLDKPTLTDRPQRLGILPTIRFWNRIDTFKHQAPALVVGMAAGIAVFALLLGPLSMLLGPAAALVVLMPLAMVASMLPLGLFERWLRREIARRGSDRE